MASKPSSKPAWVPSDDPAKVIEPSTSKKNTGWQQEEKPPFQYFNWFWNTLSKWIDYFAGQTKYNIIIDSDTDEGDFTTLAAYIAGTPVAGDRVLMRVDETITATLVIPAGVLVHLQKGKTITTATVFTPVISVGVDSVLEGEFKISTSHTGTIAKAVSITGNRARIDNIRVENTTSGIVTHAIVIEAAVTKVLVNGEVRNTGAGSITNDLTDTAANSKNYFNIRHDSGVTLSEEAEFYTDSGVADAYVLTPISLKRTPGSYYDGMLISFRPDNTSTGPSTVNVAGLGVKALRVSTIATAQSDLWAGLVTTARYNTSTGVFDILVDPGEAVFFTDSGAANAYVLTTVGSKRPPKVYYDGLKISFRAANTNTTGSTVNVSGLGVKSLRRDNVALVAGDIKNATTDITTAIYNSSTGFFDIEIPKVNVGGIVQTDNVQDGEVATGTTAMVGDNSIPQNTEGDEYMTLAFTSTKATNKLQITIVANVAHTSLTPGIQMALFKDAVVNALAACIGTKSNVTNASGQIVLVHTMVAGSTSPITFKVRIGSAAGATTTFNGASGVRIYGGVMASSINIQEIEV